MSDLMEQIEAAVEEAIDGHSFSHAYCCDPDVALCGASLKGWLECEDDCDEDRCIRCDVIDEADVPCSAPFCRLRSVWRNWRSR